MVYKYYNMKNIKYIALLAISIAFTACNDKKKDGLSDKAVDETVIDNTATSVVPDDVAVNQATVTGIVTEIQNGKDGYTAKIKDPDGVYYFVTVSIPNLKDPEGYREVKVNDEIIVSGEQWEMDGENHIKAESIAI